MAITPKKVSRWRKRFLALGVEIPSLLTALTNTVYKKAVAGEVKVA